MQQPTPRPTLAERQRAQFQRMCADRLAQIEDDYRNGRIERAETDATELAKMLGVRAFIMGGLKLRSAAR